MYRDNTIAIMADFAKIVDYEIGSENGVEGLGKGFEGL